MEIKIAVPKKKYLEGYESIFHQKIGLIEDSNGNSISFSGSINETFSAWSLNIENFKVFRNWEKNEKEYYESDRHTFFSIWNNLSDKVMVFNLDEALKKKLIKLAPKTKDEIDLNLLRGKSLPKNRTSKLPPLRKYQEEAVKSWDINNKGILEMATGTGKTIVGLKIISDFINRDSSLVLVVAPTIEICKQWRDEIANNLITDYIITVSSRNNSWKKETKNCLHRLSRSRIKSSVFISTYESLENLWGIMKGVELKNVLLIADEVHSFGATKRSKLLEDDVFSEKINNRLGLSATPERMYDDDGNKAIDSFFGGTIFKYTIGDAIRDKILCPYYFYPHIVNMSETEYREYLILTKKIGKALNSSTDKKKTEEVLTILTTKRAKIVKAAKEKFDSLRQIIKKLNENQEIKYTFIFCADMDQLSGAQDILEEQGIIFCKITGEESDESRSTVLKSFTEGSIDVISSIKILDEGVNIPKVRNAIILSNSANPREYVQRRGRVLRKSGDPNKIAKIFDFVVIPKIIPSNNEELYRLERNIIRKELIRTFEFVKYSKNKLDIFKNESFKKVVYDYKSEDLFNILRN